MPHLIVIMLLSLLWPVGSSQPAGDAGAPGLSDSERALKVVLERRDLFLPPDYALQSQPQRFGEIQVSVKLLGEAQTAAGPRKLVVVQVSARAQDGQWPQELRADWVAYFTPDMQLIERHNQGCGSALRLEGNVIHYGPNRSFDLSTPEGLAGFKGTQNWC